MHIITNQPTVEFQTLPTGAQFMFDGEVFIKMSPLIRSDRRDIYNAVCLSGGDEGVPSCIAPTSKVVRKHYALTEV